MGYSYYSPYKFFAQGNLEREKLYYYRDNIIKANVKSDDNSFGINDSKAELKDLFWSMWNKLGYKLPRNTNLCCKFEIILECQVQIINIGECNYDIVLHSARDMASFFPVDIISKEFCDQNNWKTIYDQPLETIPNMDLNTLQKYSNSLSIIDSRGILLVNHSDPGIVLHNQRSWNLREMYRATSSEKRRDLILDILRLGGNTFEYIPDLWKDEYKGLEYRFILLCTTINEAFANCGGINIEKKAFAKCASKYHFKHWLYMMYNRKEDIYEFIQSMEYQDFYHFYEKYMEKIIEQL
eukprot:TRINITY_DN5447_c0_g2_i1.p1 TRINITY_DN5447_c0_g2~~TRINITY_DN5447_c0_g2_i1.p1  ORF type:complete len:332 (-),score=53.23 TRINITY_DN5447_c0_g2_i1:22-909(-)